MIALTEKIFCVLVTETYYIVTDLYRGRNLITFLRSFILVLEFFKFDENIICDTLNLF